MHRHVGMWLKNHGAPLRPDLGPIGSNGSVNLGAFSESGGPP